MQKSKVISPKDCEHWYKCSAPICPLDENRHGMIWYADEEICHSRKYSKGWFWITKQKEVAKKIESTDTYFTVQMLSKDFRMKKTLEGCVILTHRTQWNRK